jgi:putative flippase GtrA
VRSGLRRHLSRERGIGQLARFCAVGASGYVINLTVFALVLDSAHAPAALAAVAAFAVAVCSNFVLNRYWTFSARRGHAHTQAARFLCVSLLGLGVNLVLLAILSHPLDSKTAAQALAVALSTPLTFALNRLWTFQHNGDA